MEIIGIGIGLLGFGLFAVWECIFLTRARFLKPVLLVTTISLKSWATWMVCLHPDKLPIPEWLSHLGAALAIGFFSLMVYSIFLEVPFAATYGTGIGERRLIVSGTYALCRHPGVLWYPFIGLGLFLLFSSKLILIAWPIWSLANAACIIVEEKVQLERAFGDQYRAYQSNTPMVIPTSRSLSRFLAQFTATDGATNENIRQ
ncbi:MAG: hypothetical protein M1370_10570 [Bacteroidetes bacterium]|nr:hypothetical protein [Bacteroidota bacterium]MCL5026520.1 hypothetical protein [Chloroflexota bacterium]